MAMTVLMKQTRQGDAGAVLSAGSTYTVTEALGAQLVGNGFATDVNGALQPDIDFDVSAKVNGVTGGISLRAGGQTVPMPNRTTPLRIATFGDSTANVGDTRSPANQDVSQASSSAWQSGLVLLSVTSEKYCIPIFYPQAHLVANGGISGQTTIQMVARDSLAASITRRATQDIISLAPHVILLRGGSPNDIGGVTSGTIEAAIATAYANHCLIIQRFLAAGIPVIDVGIYGFSGSATDLTQTRAALVRLNAMFKAYASLYPGRVVFVESLGRVSDSTGSFIEGMHGDGVHLNLAGSLMMGQAEATAIASLFGQSSGPRYPGANTIANASMAATSTVAHGTIATGFAITATSATRQNAKIESINGKTFQTCELVTSGAGMSQIVMPFDPSSVGLNMTAPLGIVTSDVYGFEFDFYIEPLNGATFSCALSGRLDVRDSVGSGRIVVEVLSGGYNFSLSEPIQGHLSFPPLVFGDAQANLTNASTFYFQANVGEVGTFKVGVAQPRIVKLNQPVVTM